MKAPTVNPAIAGPLFATVFSALVWLIDRHVASIPSPGAFSVLAAFVSAYVGGLRAGLIAAGTISLISGGFLLGWDPQLPTTGVQLSRISAIFFVAFGGGALIGLLQDRAKLEGRDQDTANRRLVAANEQLLGMKAALDKVGYGVVLLDRDLRATYINTAFRRMWNLSEQIVASCPTFEELVRYSCASGAHRVEAADLDEYVQCRVDLVRGTDETPLDLRLSDGRTLRLQSTVLPDGGRMLSYADVSDLVTHAEQLEKLAALDELTGLYNRRHFLEIGVREWHRSSGSTPAPLAILMIDIDHFKAINDRMGHEFGDRVIRHVGQICRRMTRDYDTVARIGGEEFVVLLPQTTLSQAAEIAERLRKAVEESAGSMSVEDLTLTVSVGVAQANRSMAHLLDLIRQADQALYAAKRAGRNRVARSSVTRATLPAQHEFAA